MEVSVRIGKKLDIFSVVLNKEVDDTESSNQ